MRPLADVACYGGLHMPTTAPTKTTETIFVVFVGLQPAMAHCNNQPFNSKN
jgi:hypothetical protein